MPTEDESLEQQIYRLEHFIISEVDGEPSQSEGAVDCAIRVIRNQITTIRDLRAETKEFYSLLDYLQSEFPGDEPSPRVSNVVNWNTVSKLVARMRAISAQRGVQWELLGSYTKQVDKLALYFRDHYTAEITAGSHAQFKDTVDAAIHYLAIERDLTQRGFWGRLKYLLWGV